MKRLFSFIGRFYKKPRVWFLIFVLLIIIPSIRPLLEYRLISCAVNNNVVGLQQMLSLGVDANTRYSDPYMAIDEASYNGHMKIVQLLISAGGNANAHTDSGETALAYAALNGHTEIVQLLLSHGADPNSGCLEMRPLRMARDAKSPYIIRILKAAGAKE